MADNVLVLPTPAEEVSDGYHTFRELYEHRHLLWMNLIQANKARAFKTRKNQEGEEWHGWFIAGMNTDYGQVTYHLPSELWDKLNVPEVERNRDYDGHTSSDVLARLTELLNA